MKKLNAIKAITTLTLFVATLSNVYAHKLETAYDNGNNFSLHNATGYDIKLKRDYRVWSYTLKNNQSLSAITTDTNLCKKITENDYKCNFTITMTNDEQEQILTHMTVEIIRENLGGWITSKWSAHSKERGETKITNYLGGPPLTLSFDNEEPKINYEWP